MSKTKIVVTLLIVLMIGTSSLAQVPAIAKPEEAVTSGPIRVTVTQLSLVTRDLVYDPVGDKIYASIPSSAGSNGNSIVSMSVPTGTVSAPIFVGSEPNKLAVSDDGTYLYVGLDGAAAVRRVDLISQTADIQFPLGSGFCGAYNAEDMVVLKGNASALAVSKRNTGCSPRHEGVSIYDDGVERATKTARHTGSNVIEPSDSASVLYGYNNETTEFGFRVMSVITTGVIVTSTTQGLISGFGVDIRFDGGLIYATNGRVINPRSRSIVGTFAGSGPVAPDASEGRVYFLNTSSGTTHLMIFDQATFVPITSLTIPGVSGAPSSLIKVDDHLLAFRTSAGQVFILKVYELNHLTYLPFVSTPPSSISGRVTLNGAPAAGVSLDLILYEGGTGFPRASTTTGPDGRYAFINPPGLSAGQLYYVLFLNSEETGDGRLAAWITRSLTSFSAGSNVEFGEFDIADISLVSPKPGDTVSLPATFRWTLRAATPSDSYQLEVFDPNYPTEFYSPLLGYIDEYTLMSLPEAFDPGHGYGWDVVVNSPDGGTGVSFYYNPIIFTNNGLPSSQATSSSSPQAPILILEKFLRRHIP